MIITDIDYEGIHKCQVYLWMPGERKSHESIVILRSHGGDKMAAIEPISSAMTYQAQITPKTTVQSDEKTAAQNEQNNAANVEAAAKSDPKVLNVTESGNTDTQDGKNDSGKESNSTLASNEQLKEAIAKFNKSLTSNTEAVFGIHEKTHRVMIKIVDKDTKKVVREFPPEKTLDMLAKMWEMAGILVDEKK